jgi:hypothetical protein
VPDEIRRGAWMSSPSYCTMAFVVRDAAGKLYITTAAHCVDFAGQDVSLFNVGRIGTVKARAGQDMALVEIEPAMYSKVNPTMVGWGGPTGLATEAPQDKDPLLHYGWGYAGTFVLDQTRCRAHVYKSDGSNRSVYEANGHISNGDSGSGIMTADGKALGLTNWGWVLIAAPTARFGGPRFDQGLLDLGAVAGLDLELVPGEPVRPVCVEDPLA